MSETAILNTTIEEEHKGIVVPEREMTQKERDIVATQFAQFTMTAQNRDRNFDYLDGRNLTTYINDNVKRFVTNIDERDDIEDWQARVFDPFTRNKVIAILSKVAAAMPKPEFMAVGDEDFQRAQILGDLYSHADRVDDTEELMFYALLEATVKGTVIGYEGYEEKTRTIKEISRSDGGDTVLTRDGKKITRKLVGSIVPLEDFYPESVGIRKISDMSKCYWRSIVGEVEFNAKFAQYEKAKLVKPFMRITDEAMDRPFYLDYVSNDIPDGHVEVIRYYNQDTDEFIITANGVWLNPIGEEEVSPIPFTHKALPFWKAIYEPLGADFFFGKALPDKLKSMQDVINVLHNMMLDQSFLSIFPPILTSGIDDIEDDFLRPGRRIPVNDVAGYKELTISPPSSFHEFILNYTKRVLEETSVDAVNQGIAGVGDRTTATEIERAAQSVMSILGLFAQFVKWGVRDKARLRAQNILQFYTGPLVEKIGGEGLSGDVTKAFNTFKIEDTVLTGGKRGIKIIEMFKGPEQMPTKTALRVGARILETETGRHVEKIAINPQYIRDFEFDIKLIPNPSTGESKALKKALFMEFTKVSLEFFPELADKEALYAELTSLFDYRPEKFMVNKEQNPPQEITPGAPGDLGVSQNIMRGAAPNATGGQSIRDLAATA